ncbi:hypothetical protein ACLIBG_10215 [Virgibacillus sp. W0181]|uniref:hypothetical protein n=1 Tax=Virgibacillus sp. W0181 TaxID=3391581 RepID=UPI003F45F633
MEKKKGNKNGNKIEKYKNEKDIDVVKNQVMESYQDGVIEDQLDNNRGIYTFNNQKK